MGITLRPNQLIEIELGAGKQDDHYESFTSRIEEVLPQSLLVAAPIKNGDIFNVADDEIITLRFILNDVLYSGLCRVVSRSEHNVPLLKVTRPEIFSRIQQRSWVRTEVLLPVAYRMAGYPVDFYHAHAVNLSGGGCLLLVKHLIDLDTQLELQLTISDSFILECQGRVTRCQQDETDANLHKVGIMFEDIDDTTTERIVTFIFQKQREHLSKFHMLARK